MKPTKTDPDHPENEFTPVLILRRSAWSWAGVYVVLALLGGAIIVAAVYGRFTLPFPLPLPGAIAAAVALLVAGHVVVAIQRSATRYRIFRSTIELQTGIISRRIENVQMFRVRDLALQQGLLNRLLGVGDVIVSSTDESRPRLVIRGVRDPLRVYDTLRELLSASQATRQTMIVEREPPSERPS